MSAWWNQPVDDSSPPGDEPSEEHEPAQSEKPAARRRPARRSRAKTAEKAEVAEPASAPKSTGRAATRKTTARKTATRTSASTKKASAEKTESKKADAPEDAAPKTATRKTATRTTATGKPAARKKAAAQNTETKKPAQTAAARKARAEKPAAKKAPASRRTTARKTAAAEKPAQDLKFDSESRPQQVELLVREIDISPERTPSVTTEPKIALFCDLENIALGVRDSEVKKFDINLILERLLEKGKIIVKKAYADWERYSEYKRPFHEAAIEMIGIPQRSYSGKNSADIKMVVDALDLSYSKEHLDTFALLSGDSDFSPLVSKLKENNKRVIGIGVKNSSSHLLIDNCDEFIFYEDVWRDRQQATKAQKVQSGNKKGSEAFSLMVDAIQALLRENKDVLWGSMIKQTMQRKKPSFNEGYYGYGSFSDLLEDAQEKGLIKLKKDQRSGTYIVTGFAGR